MLPLTPYPQSHISRTLTHASPTTHHPGVLAEAAFFYGQDRTMRAMWKEFCDPAVKGLCDAPLDLVAVPYFVHRDDLRRIAPLWKKYILAIRDKADTESEDPAAKAAAEAFKRRYRGVQVRTFFTFFCVCCEGRRAIPFGARAYAYHVGGVTYRACSSHPAPASLCCLTHWTSQPCSSDAVAS